MNKYVLFPKDSKQSKIAKRKLLLPEQYGPKNGKEEWIKQTMQKANSKPVTENRTTHMKWK